MTQTLDFPSDPMEDVDAAFESTLDGSTTGFSALLRGIRDDEAAVRLEAADALKQALELLETDELKAVQATVAYQLAEERSTAVSPALIALMLRCRNLLRYSDLNL